MEFTRITVRSDQMAGKPCIRNMRIPVSVVLAMLADGMTEAEILDAYPDLESEDISESLKFASWMASGRSFPVAASQ